jgi:ABC-type multidrug transport system fused ATPase/permease subunit
MRTLLSRVLQKYRENVHFDSLKRCLDLLTKRDKKRLFQITILQMAMGIFDLIGVAVIGVLGALAISGVQSKQPEGAINTFLDFTNLNNLQFQVQVAILGIFAAFVFVTKTLFSMYFSRVILRYLSNKSAAISSELVSKLLNGNLQLIQKRTTHETIYALTTGVSTITVGIVGSAVTIITDSSLMLMLSLGLFVYDPLMATLIIVTFASIGVFLYFALHNRARIVGEAEARLNVASFEKISEVLISYRETFVRGRRQHYASEIGEIRSNLARYVAELAFMPNISKYIIESVVVLGGMFIAATQFVLRDATAAVGALAVFVAAGSRIAPAVLRIQQGAISVRGNLGIASPTLDLADEIKDLSPSRSESEISKFDYPGFSPSIEVKDASFQYGTHGKFQLSNISLTVEAGSFIAIVGPSGSGKSTLLDLMLGLQSPLSGTIQISGMTPVEVINRWPGAISYVPQEVSIKKGSIRQNVAMGFSELEDTDLRIKEALEKAQLIEMLNHENRNIDSIVGESGNSLSGGQKQRLGIARALFTNPRLLFMDEATSALDGQTENNISNAIRSLHGEVTVIVIAHRLSTVISADKVAYLDNGKLLAFDTFARVRKQVPDFDNQAKLMGL